MNRLIDKLELNKIYNMDCLEGMKLIPDKTIDMILTDLPYGTTACKWDVVIPFELLWKQYNRIIKDNGAVVLFGSEPFSSKMRMSNLEMYRYDWIWKKTVASNFVMCNKQPLKKHETISVFYKKQPIYNPQMEPGIPYVDNRSNGNRNTFVGEQTILTRSPIKNNGVRYPSSVQEFSNGNNKNVHKTQKPLNLCEYLIKTYTNEKGIILDSCIGSGTTAIAALQTNRDFIGFETEKEYFEIANRRIESVKKG